MATQTEKPAIKPLLMKRRRFDISRLVAAGVAQACRGRLGGRGGRSAAGLDQTRQIAASPCVRSGTTKDDTSVVSRPAIAAAADDVVLRLENVTVDLPIYSPRGRSLQLAVLNLAVGGKLSEKVGRTVHVRALDQVSFDVHRGDRIGLLGHNGSGKSTLLKVVSSIYLPTSGRMHSSVNVLPLLDFNLGVDDDMTGVEAVRVGCMLRGVSKDRISEAMADICEFTELGEFLNLPIRTYSAGMRARLAFGTATAVRPEAIAIDENLATGDAQFIRKARQRADQFIGGAALLFLASHQDEILRSFCNRGIVLRSGRVEFCGPINEAIGYYNGGTYQSAAPPSPAAVVRAAA
jgi:homopolymeric O-antigen transport system ATP-binding protein